jgi:MFS family permease
MITRHQRATLGHRARMLVIHHPSSLSTPVVTERMARSMLSGFFGSTTSVVFAYVGAVAADSEERTRRVGSIYAVMGAAFVCGPAFAGPLFALSPTVRNYSPGPQHMLHAPASSV